MQNLISETLQAELRIRPYILQTPLAPSLCLSRIAHSRVYLKMESEQYTNSFKFRGAINKLLSLSEDEKARGVVTASTGNHAQGIARALSITGGEGVIFLPEQPDASKLEALQEYNVDLEFYGHDSLETELHARKIAGERGAVWISPYNDPQIIGGQGTIGIELTEQIKRIDDIFITVGGGGLISGIATYLTWKSPHTRIIGCLPENAPDMYRCVEADEIVSLEQKETLSDGSAGGVEPGSITFPVCRTLVDEYILVSENEIKEALRLIVDKHHKIIEGAAAVAVAGFLKHRERLRDRTVVIVICGGNIATEKLMTILR